MVALNVQIEVHMIDKSKSKAADTHPAGNAYAFCPVQYASMYPFFYRLKPAYFCRVKLP